MDGWMGACKEVSDGLIGDRFLSLIVRIKKLCYSSFHNMHASDSLSYMQTYVRTIEE